MKRLEESGQPRPVGHLHCNREQRPPYFFPVPFRATVAPISCLAKGEAAGAAFGFSFFGFLASRLPRCSPFAIVRSSSPRLVQRLHYRARRGDFQPLIAALPSFQTEELSG